MNIHAQMSQGVWSLITKPFPEPVVPLKAMVLALTFIPLDHDILRKDRG